MATKQSKKLQECSKALLLVKTFRASMEMQLAEMRKELFLINKRLGKLDQRTGASTLEPASTEDRDKDQKNGGMGHYP